MKILLFGCNGQVGWELQRSLAPLGRLFALDCQGGGGLAGDFTDMDGVASTVRSVGPDVIVNAAAHTAVDRAESEPELAEKLNAEAPAALAEEARKTGAWLVHYSTDYVFDGSGDQAWDEDAPPAPLNVYGRTKRAGEAAVEQSGCRFLIFRTSWVYAAGGTNFIHAILRLAHQRDRVDVIDDQVGAPTGAELLADAIADAEAETGRRIGEHGLPLIEQALAEQGEAGPVNILTHCNAGWLACVDWGTALAPVYRAHDAGIPVHVWVDETRPRNQGAALTTWELAAHGVPHTLVADNAGGHLMQQGQVDLCLVGTDRTTRKGDVANKIGTYLKALAARASGVPFHVALPGTTIDWATADGADIPIEERAAEEVLRVRGRTEDGRITDVAIAPEGTMAANPAFDVTPAELVSKLVTERGVCEASAGGLASLYPERSG